MYIANVHALRGARGEAAWILEKLLECRVQYKLTLGQEYQLLGYVGEFADLATPGRADGWIERRREIADMWANEVEAAAPDDDLAAACNVVSRTSR